MIKKSILITFMLILLVNFCTALNQEKKEDAKSLFVKAKESLKTRDVDNALKYMEKAVAQDSKNSLYHYELGLIYNVKLNKVQGMAQLGWATKMKEAWEKAVKLNPDNLKAVLGLTQYHLNAPPIAGGSRVRAKELIKTMLKLDPLAGYCFYADIYTKEKNLEKAEENARKALKLYREFKKINPRKKSLFNANVFNVLGYGYLNAKKLDKAIEIFQENTKLFPRFFNVYDSLAEACMIKGDKKRAIKYYQEAMALNPQKSNFEKRAYKGAQKNLDKLTGKNPQKKAEKK